MGTVREVLVPDIGDFQDVEIIEILVGLGDAIENIRPVETVDEMPGVL